MFASVLLTWPLAAHLGTALVGGDDPVLNSWILAWDVHALTTNPLHLYQANIFFPFPLPLTYSETLFSGALLIAPVLWTTENPVLAHNVLTLLSLSLAGFGVFLLVRELTGNTPAAIVGGLIFAFSPYQQDQLIHVQLLQTGWLPLTILFLYRAMRDGSLKDFVLFGLFFVCEAWASYYLFFLACVAVATFLGFEALTNPRFWRTKTLARLGSTLAVTAMCVIPPALPYRQTQQTFHFQWDMAILRDFSAFPTDYLALSLGKWFNPPWFKQFEHPTFPNEHALFPGFVTLALASLSLIALSRGRQHGRASILARVPNGQRTATREIVRYLAVLLVAFVLSFGPYLAVAGRTDPVPMPYLALLTSVPGFTVMRVPARFEFLVLLALGVLAGIGVSWLSETLRPRLSTPVRGVAFGVVAVALALDLLPVPRGLVPMATGADVPPVYGWLRGQSSGVVAEIPSTQLANFAYEYLSTYHWHPLVNGVSGFNPPQFAAISAQLEAFPDQAAVDNLRSLGVRYVVAHRAALGDRVNTALDAADLSTLRLTAPVSFGSDVVYELAPVQRPPDLQDHAQLALPAQIGRGVPAAAVLSFTNDSSDPISVNGPQTANIEVTVNESAARQSEVPVLPDAAFIRPRDEITQAIPLVLDPSVTSGREAQVHVRVSGPVQLEAARVVQFVDLPTSAQRTGLLASVTSVQVPRVIHAAATMQINLVARNVGQAIWLADTGGDMGRVGVAVRGWSRPDGASVATNGSDLAAHLNWNVNPGQEAAFTLVAHTPPLAGEYTLALDLLSESVTFFEDVNGGARTLLPIHVDN